MGIGGHILGDRKLRLLRERTGLDLDRAYRRGSECAGRMITDGVCRHYEIDFVTGAYTVDPDPVHWASCPDGDPWRERPSDA